MVSLCYVSKGLVCPGTAMEARLDGIEELNALANLFTFIWLSHQLLFFVFTSIIPIISFQSSKDPTTRVLIVKCDGQCVQHRYGCRGEIGNIFFITFSYLKAWECCVKVHMYIRLHVGTIGDVGPGCWTSALPAISKSPLIATSRTY